MKAWEPEEDQIIMEMLERLGPKWSKIVQRLPGRTVSSVRNRWQRIDKGRRLRESGQESKNRCQQCGKPKRGHVCMAKLKNRGESGEVATEALKLWERAQGGSAGEEDEEDEVDDCGEVSVVPYVSRASSLGSVAGEVYAPVVEHVAPPLLSRRESFGFNALAAAAEAELQRSNSYSSLSGSMGSTTSISSTTSMSSTASTASTVSVVRGESLACSETMDPPGISRMSSAPSERDEKVDTLSLLSSASALGRVGVAKESIAE